MEKADLPSKVKISRHDSADIEEIMERFDFKRVELCMLVLRWEWAYGSERHIPSVGEIKHFARKLLTSMSHSSSKCYSSSGGFTSAREPNGRLSLIFAVEEWTAEDDSR